MVEKCLPAVDIFQGQPVVTEQIAQDFPATGSIRAHQDAFAGFLLEGSEPDEWISQTGIDRNVGNRSGGEVFSSCLIHDWLTAQLHPGIGFQDVKSLLDP